MLILPPRKFKDIYDNDGGTTFLFDELFGGTLTEKKAKWNEIKEDEETKRIFFEVLEALHICHGQGFVHNDVKSGIYPLICFRKFMSGISKH